jgi:hypothetical protein
MAQGGALEGKWKGNWRMEWVAITLHTTLEHGVCSISTITTFDAHTSAASSRLNWPPPANLNELVRFAAKRNLVSAHMPSYFERSLRYCCCVFLPKWWLDFHQVYPGKRHYNVWYNFPATSQRDLAILIIARTQGFAEQSFDSIPIWIKVKTYISIL